MTDSHPEYYAPVIALSGGVGGAKLVLGLARAMDPSSLTVIANTGDDFDHLGLRVCPDIDTLVYTLSGLSNPETGWGRKGETGHFMDILSDLGEETWFFLGDQDLAMHVARTRRLASGQHLSEVTREVCESLGLKVRILPMSDDTVATRVETEDGLLPFQHYFVRDRCAPRVRGFQFEGAANATPNPAFLDALADRQLHAVIVAPSNPFISIDPILALPGVRSALQDCAAPVVAVTPIVHGEAIKGPTAKMMRELDIETTAVAVARHYADIIDGFVLDAADADIASQVEALGIKTITTNTVMDSLDDRVMLARDVLEFCHHISPSAGDHHVSG